MTPLLDETIPNAGKPLDRPATAATPSLKIRSETFLLLFLLSGLSILATVLFTKDTVI